MRVVKFRRPHPAQLMTPAFVHLRLHSEFTVTDGIVRIDEAVARAAADGMPALALTDLANVFGMVKFYKAARGAGREAGHRLRRLDRATRPSATSPRACCSCAATARAICSCANCSPAPGWKTSSAAAPRSARTGCSARRRRPARAVRRARRANRQARWRRQQRAGGAPGRGMGAAVPAALLHRVAALRAAAVRRAAIFSARWRSPAGCNCRWWRPIRCSSSSPTISRRTRRACASPRAMCWPTSAGRAYSRRSSYFKTQAEMAQLFADMPEALANSVEIARRCNLDAGTGQEQAAAVSRRRKA